MDLTSIREVYERLHENMRNVIVGKNQTLQNVIIGLFCQGHLLIEDIPGVGKTILARTLARTINCTFKRIQFTPDMLPSDVVGISIYNQDSRTFEYRPGPIVTQILLADEINRATPKTQSALLEGMEERQVTVDGLTHPLPSPFMVLATQNPIEYEGTFNLPEAQLDRFLLKINLGYPAIQDEVKVLEMQQLHHPITSLESVISVPELLEIQEQIKQVYVSDNIKKYIVQLIRATRDHEDIYLGASPRGSIGLFKTAQAKAAIEGRDHVIPDDVKDLIIPVLSHRIILNPSGRIRNLKPEDILLEISTVTSIPGEE